MQNSVTVCIVQLPRPPCACLMHTTCTWHTTNTALPQICAGLHALVGRQHKQQACQGAHDQSGRANTRLPYLQGVACISVRYMLRYPDQHARRNSQHSNTPGESQVSCDHVDCIADQLAPAFVCFAPNKAAALQAHAAHTALLS